jgi:large subunit ribosomal protein L25
VRCLPTAIPPFLVDVSHLGVGQSVHVRELVTKGVTVLTDPEVTLATVVAPTVQEETPAEGVAVAAEGGAAEPEVITKGKKDDEEGAKDDKGDKGDKGGKGKEKGKS